MLARVPEIQWDAEALKEWAEGQLRNSIYECYNGNPVCDN